MDFYLGEIRLFPYNRIPSADGWMACSGQTLSINGNQALYSLIGIYYGGDAKTNFMLPNLNGRTIIGYGSKYKIGLSGGYEKVTLVAGNMPVHTHTVAVRNSYDAMLPKADLLGNPNIQTSSSQTAKNASKSLLYTKDPVSDKMVTLNPASISLDGGNLGHENRMPFIAMVYCIATKGTYPPRP